MISPDMSPGTQPDKPRDPVRHFQARACSRCLCKPCIRFRLCGVWGGKFEFVHRGDGGGGDCPFNVQSAAQLKSLLFSSSSEELYSITSRVLGELSPVEHMYANPGQFLSSPHDFSENRDFLVGLWEDGIIHVLHVPANYRMYPKLRAWITGERIREDRSVPEVPQWLIQRLYRNDTQEPAADMGEEETTQQPLKITDIGWRHKNESRRQKSPDTARQADTVELTATFENYVEGAGVDFFVYGNVAGNRKQLSKIHTRCKDMGAVVEWPVDVSKCDDEPEIKFYCEARSKKSAECPIEVEMIEEYVFSM